MTASSITEKRIKKLFVSIDNELAEKNILKSISQIRGDKSKLNTNEKSEIAQIISFGIAQRTIKNPRILNNLLSLQQHFEP